MRLISQDGKNDLPYEMFVITYYHYGESVEVDENIKASLRSNSPFRQEGTKIIKADSFQIKAFPANANNENESYRLALYLDPEEAIDAVHEMWNAYDRHEMTYRFPLMETSVKEALIKQGKIKSEDLT